MISYIQAILRVLRTVRQMIVPSQVSIQLSRCPICGPSVICKLRDDSITVRCLHCGGSAIHMSIVEALRKNVPNIAEKDVYELSSRGALFKYLSRKCKTLAYSEYYADVPKGTYRNNVQCQDVQEITYADQSFDLVTSTEVFEHVPDDFLGFKEVYRVLRPSGKFIFTVPFTGADKTIERATLVNGRINHLLPPTYHGDRIRGQGKVLCYRDYGLDIVDRLRTAGFSQVRIEHRKDSIWWGLGADVVIARKAAQALY
jgi:SAM-dependent methyltransferase